MRRILGSLLFTGDDVEKPARVPTGPTCCGYGQGCGADHSPDPDGGGGADLGIGRALEKLRRENNLAYDVHDPAEDEPRIVALPGEPNEHAVVTVPPTHHNWLAILFVVAVILAAIVAIVVGAMGTAEILGQVQA